MEATEPTPGTLRADVWLALHGAPAGLTDSELDAQLTGGIPPLVWRIRRGELVAEGAVLDSGRTRGGETVWVTRRRPFPEPAQTEPEMPPPPPPVSDNRPTALLVDGKNLLYRALMSKGEPVDVDFPKRLRALLERFAPRFAILTWDADGPTWRHAAYADYKGQRDAPSAYEKSVYAQVPGWAAQCGYQFVEAPGWEADDIIGTYTARLREAHRVVIVSNDKDFAQLLDRPGVIMLKGWEEVITHEDVPKPPPAGWGVQPRYIPDLLAIMGDVSDNIPGVPKVGAVGAAKLINLFGGCEAIIEACKCGKDKAKGRSDRIVESAVALRLFLRLTTISQGIADLAAPVECSAMPPSSSRKREALDGMTVLDGVLFPLPETAHMALQLGWRWSNPTAMPDRKQSQLRPGEPIERWEKEDHWGYLVERGGQWTFVHRGIDGEVETGRAHLSEAMAEFCAYHVAYAAMSDALFGVKLLASSWTTDAPIIALAKVDEALADARQIVAHEHARLATGPAPASFPATGTEAQRAALHAQVDYQAMAAALFGVEYDTPDGAVALGTIELPGSVAGVDRPFEVDVRVTCTSPLPVPSAPMLPPRTLVAEGIRPVAASAPTAVLPSAPAEAPWAIPTARGQTTIPVGYAHTIVALTLEAFTGEPQLLVWDVNLKTDLGTPPDEPTDPNGWSDGRWTKLLDRLQAAIAAQVNDPAAQKPLVAVVRGIEGEPGTTAVLDFKPALVNVARIANGPPPVGRWSFAAQKDALAWGPRVRRDYFMDGIPFAVVMSIGYALVQGLGTMATGGLV